MLSHIGTDLHLHLIPNIDDGSRSIEESIEIISNHYASGIRRIIATPHIRSDIYLNTTEGIQAAFEPLMALNLEKWPGLQLSYAAEYFADDHFITLLEKGDILPLFDNFVLVESSMRYDQPHFIDTIKLMQKKGWRPVLAHPERYRTWWNNPQIYDQVYDMGVIFQVNLLSLVGNYGPNQKEMAELLIRQGKVNAIGSDIHHAKQYPDILKATKNTYFTELCDYPLLNRNEL